MIPVLPGRVSVGLLLWRIVIGLAYVQHGLPKIEHPASWMTMMMGTHAFAPPWLQAIVAIVEFFGGIALVLGLLTPVAAIGIGIDMATAIFTVHLPMGGHWVGGQGSFEIPLFYLTSMIALLLTGPGAYSIDAMTWGRVRASKGSA
jgi:putative oxidoreductase